MKTQDRLAIATEPTARELMEKVVRMIKRDWNKRKTINTPKEFPEGNIIAFIHQEDLDYWGAYKVLTTAEAYDKGIVAKDGNNKYRVYYVVNADGKCEQIAPKSRKYA
jgi:hypothetical protein